MKRIAILIIGCLFFSGGLFSVEVGLIGGVVTNPSHLNYGLSSSLGVVVPLIKFEFELTRKGGVEESELANAISVGIKFRPRFGKIWPYAVLGVGTEFRSFFNFDFDEYEGYAFVGGGIHYELMAVLSVRGDLRFINFSGRNRTRLTAGIFLHL